MNLDDMLGIDLSSPVARRARRLRESDRKLIADLVARRKKLDLSQGEVARRMDTGQSTVARIESGARDVHQSTLRRYAMAVEAIVEHRVIPDDRAIAWSTDILRDFRDQLQPSASDGEWCALGRAAWSTNQDKRVLAKPGH